MRERAGAPAAAAPVCDGRAGRLVLGRVFRKLAEAHGRPRLRRAGPALDELIQTLLSQNTSDPNSQEGFRRLKAAFPDWAAVESAPWRRVAAAIRVSGLSNVKSHRIQAILRRIREERGEHSIEFLRTWTPVAARDYLRAIPGVGPKTAACVLLFSFGMPVFPVDTHIHRVTGRLGLISARASAEEAHDLLQAMMPGEWVHPLHLLLIRHGREVCHARKPECDSCVLYALCLYGRAHPRTPKRKG